MIFPGPGIGGYCLPKDGGLGYWAYQHILGFEDGDSVFKITPTAIDINDTRGLHVAELVRDALRNMGRYIAGAEVLVCGASYRQDVGDTRYSGSEMVLRKLAEMGAYMRVHDPYVEHWYELEMQETYPSPGHSWSRFFRNQEDLRIAPGRQGPRRSAQGSRGGHLRGAARSVPEARSVVDRAEGRRSGRRHRLLRHPLRRRYPALLRARLRGQGARARARAADQGSRAAKDAPVGRGAGRPRRSTPPPATGVIRTDAVS